MKRIAWLLALGVVVGGCAPKAETPEEETARIQRESNVAKTAIEEANKAFTTHFNLGHGDIAAQSYTPDAVLALVNSPVVSGRENIAKAISGMGEKPQLVLTTAAVTANGPLAVERGTYAITLTMPSGPATESGTYLVHWHRVDGKWLIAEDIGTSEKPMPMPPPPPAPKK
ncbi:MAG: nuclear transport factor 2 family protein [Gemmatimonadota bacterium]